MTTFRKITPEKQVQNGVLRLLKFHGWYAERNQQGLGSKPGRPDLQAIKKGVTIYVECKAPKGSLSDNQKKYIEMLREHGAIVYVVKDVEHFMEMLENLQEQLWPNQNIKRLF